MRRTQPITKGQDFFNNPAHVQLLQWLHGKPQHQSIIFLPILVKSYLLLFYGNNIAEKIGNY